MPKLLNKLIKKIHIILNKPWDERIFNKYEIFFPKSIWNTLICMHYTNSLCFISFPDKEKLLKSCSLYNPYGMSILDFFGEKKNIILEYKFIMLIKWDNYLLIRFAY